MPFTFSHPAVLLPLALLPKRWISLTGLVLGSIAPDFERFSKMRLSSAYSHTWESIFWFSLPLALLLSFLYHLVVRDHFIDHLPNYFYQRLSRFKCLDWLHYFKKNIAAVVFSIIIGAASHLILDNFTHQYGAFVSLFPYLQHKILLFNFKVSLVRLLDIAFSLLGGLTIICLLISLRPERVSSKPGSKKLIYWAIFSFTAMFIFLLRLFTGLNPQRIWDAGITLISATLISFVLSSLWFKIAFALQKK